LSGHRNKKDRGRQPRPSDQSRVFSARHRAVALSLARRIAGGPRKVTPPPAEVPGIPQPPYVRAMPDVLTRPWPWYVAGPIIGLMVPALLLLGNKSFGFSSNLRHICAACFPGKVAFFRYDWKKTGTWNLAFLAGTLLGGVIGARPLAAGSVAFSARTRAALTALCIHVLSGLVPREALHCAAHEHHPRSATVV